MAPESTDKSMPQFAVATVSLDLDVGRISPVAAITWPATIGGSLLGRVKPQTDERMMFGRFRNLAQSEKYIGQSINNLIRSQAAIGHKPTRTNVNSLACVQRTYIRDQIKIQEVWAASQLAR
jgi:hypothetical protein